MTETELDLIAAARTGDRDAARKLLDEGVDVDRQDGHGWSALHWAAGRGDADLVRLLLDRGADAGHSARDGRTALRVARAAGRGEVVEILRRVEAEGGGGADGEHARPYCRAYRRAELERFTGFPAGGDDGSGDEDRVAFVHHDLTVTASMWHGEDVILEEVTPEWRRFCERELRFQVPTDLS